MSHSHRSPDGGPYNYTPPPSGPENPYPAYPAQGPTPPPPPPEKEKNRIGWFVAIGAIIVIVIIAVMNVPRTGQVSGPPVVAPTSTPLATAQATQPTQSGVATFGQRFTFASGLAIEVATPVSFQPSQYSAGHDRQRAIVVTTTVVNGSNQPYQFNSMIMGPNATHAGENAPQIFDSGNKLSTEPLTMILPGKSFTYKTAFSIGEERDALQLQYAEELIGSTPAIFVGDI